MGTINVTELVTEDFLDSVARLESLDHDAIRALLPSHQVNQVFRGLLGRAGRRSMTEDGGVLRSIRKHLYASSLTRKSIHFGLYNIKYMYRRQKEADEHVGAEHLWHSYEESGNVGLRRI